MARFRHYSNGIYGIKTKGWYAEIVSSEGRKKTFRIVDKDGNRYPEIYDNLDDALWQIDINTATLADKITISKLYQYEIFELSELLIKYYEVGDNQDEENKIIGEWIFKVRERKAADLPMGFDPVE